MRSELVGFRLPPSPPDATIWCSMSPADTQLSSAPRPRVGIPWRTTQEAARRQARQTGLLFPGCQKGWRRAAAKCRSNNLRNSLHANWKSWTPLFCPAVLLTWTPAAMARRSTPRQRLWIPIETPPTRRFSLTHSERRSRCWPSAMAARSLTSISEGSLDSRHPRCAARIDLIAVPTWNYRSRGRSTRWRPATRRGFRPRRKRSREACTVDPSRTSTAATTRPSTNLEKSSASRRTHRTAPSKPSNGPAIPTGSSAFSGILSACRTMPFAQRLFQQFVCGSARP